MSLKLIMALFIVLAFHCPRAPAADAKPLNILLLYADDWRFDTLSCAGNPVVKTPHLAW